MPFASLQRLARIGFWLVAAAILALSLVPGTLRPHTLLHGEAEHFAAYFALGVTLELGYGHRIGPGAATLFLVALPAVLEFAQAFVPGRHPEPVDFLVSAAGALLGGGLVLVALRLRQARR